MGLRPPVLSSNMTIRTQANRNLSMRYFFVVSLLVGCTSTSASRPDPQPVQPQDALRPGTHAELEALVPRALELRAPAELFDLREIQPPETLGPCELDALAGPPKPAPPANYNSSLVETYDHRNCPVYQSTTRYTESEQLTLTIDGMYGEWRRSMWRTKLNKGMSAGTESADWVDTPLHPAEQEQQTQNEYDDRGYLIKEVSTYDNVRNVTTYDYDGQGRILAIWRDQGNGLRRVEAYGYGDHGTDLIQYFDTTGQLARETHYQYDDRGVLRMVSTRSLLTATGYPAYSREEYDENGNPIASTTDQDGDGKADAEWRQEFGPYGMTYRRDRYTQDGRDSVTQWWATYDVEGRLLRSQSISTLGDRTERLELTVNQRDADGRWRAVRLSKDASGIYGDIDVSTDQQFLYNCQLQVEDQQLTCQNISAYIYGTNNLQTQYCTLNEQTLACQRYVHDANGFVVTELFDDNGDGIAERRVEYRQGDEYTDQLIGYLTPARWAQIQATQPPVMEHLPEHDD